MNKKGNILLILVPIVLLTVLSVGLYLILKKGEVGQVNAPEQKQVNNQTPSTATESKNSVFLRSIPNFDSLKISDLPNFTDVRGIFNYNNHQIVIGIDRIVEWNPATGQYVRISDPKKIVNVRSGIVLDKFLYVSSEVISSLDDWPGKRIVVKIDLASGEIVKKYLDNDSRRFANLTLVNYGNKIWASSWDGIFVLDPVTGAIKMYPSVACRSGHIYIKENILKSPCDMGDATYVYDPSNDLWKKDKYDVYEIGGSMNKRLSDFNLPLPEFFSISQQINGKYYLLSDKGVYTLGKTDFPKFYNGLKDVHSYDQTKSKVYVTKDENYIILIGPETCMQYCSLLLVNLVDFKRNVVTDLLTANEVYKALSVEKKQNLADRIVKSSIEETQNQIILKNPDNTSLAAIEPQNTFLNLNP